MLPICTEIICVSQEKKNHLNVYILKIMATLKHTPALAQPLSIVGMPQAWAPHSLYSLPPPMQSI